MAGKRILIVDDDQDLLLAVAAILASEGYTVITAADREEGMAGIRSEKPDLAILDVMMNTWEDGFAMSREIKADPQSKDMPILMLTGIKAKTGIDFKPSAGNNTWCPVDGFLDKPVDPEVLVAEVKRLLQR